MRKNKIKYKTLRIEIRITHMFQQILAMEASNKAISKYIKECIAKDIIKHSRNYFNYTIEQQNYIKNNFLDSYNS